MRMLDPVASRLPWMVAAGNHEIETNGAYPGTKPFVAYEHRFRMPAVDAPVNLGHECGTGGGLDGDGVICGEGFGAEEADAAANEEAAQLVAAVAGLGGDGGVVAGDAVGAAVRRVSREARKAFDATGAGGVSASEVGAEGGAVSCCPSEWSGTYDFGNRWGAVFGCVCLYVCCAFNKRRGRTSGSGGAGGPVVASVRWQEACMSPRGGGDSTWQHVP